MIFLIIKKLNWNFWWSNYLGKLHFTQHDSQSSVPLCFFCRHYYGSVCEPHHPINLVFLGCVTEHQYIM